MSEHELTAHIYELETKLEEVSKDRDDWARKYQELRKENEIIYGYDPVKGFASQYKHKPYGYKIITHSDGTITVTPAEEKK